jgi:hypothetical protein
MNFGSALEILKHGGQVARSGWNGRGMFVYLVPYNSYPAQTAVAKAHFGEGALVPYHAYLALVGVDGAVSTWAPSVGDALAEDWYATEESPVVRVTEPRISLPPHQQRVIDERADLVGKLDKLTLFLETDPFSGLDPAERQRLRDQHEAMTEYASVLEDRIVAFTE